MFFLSTAKEEEVNAWLLDNQSHASSSGSSSEYDFSWQWPTCFWTQFKVPFKRLPFLVSNRDMTISTLTYQPIRTANYKYEYNKNGYRFKRVCVRKYLPRLAARQNRKFAVPDEILVRVCSNFTYTYSEYQIRGSISCLASRIKSRKMKMVYRVLFEVNWLAMFHLVQKTRP